MTSNRGFAGCKLAVEGFSDFLVFLHPFEFGANLVQQVQHMGDNAGQPT